MVRVQSVYIEDGIETEETMVFDTILNKNASTKQMKAFGFAKENGEHGMEIWPFILEIKENEDESKIIWGSGAIDSECHLNIALKQIRSGEYFTRYDSDNEGSYSYTYRIKNVIDWNEL